MNQVRQVEDSLRECSRTVDALLSQAGRIDEIGTALVAALRSGNKIMTAGNGGSAAEALHMAEELVGRFKGNRIALPGIALVADPTALTCIGNDYGFDEIFSRQVEGIGKAGDVLVLFSTSGSGANLSRALEAANARGVRTLCLLGKGGGRLAGKGTWEVIVPGSETARIQEAHQVLLHIFLEIIERAFA